MASKYNDRAFIATSKVGISIHQIRMAVLVQKVITIKLYFAKVIPAQYAFVIHTKNPSTNNEKQIYAEVVQGLGETLVGTYQGQAFSFVASKG
jgi:alpha-glucan, water dikinase